MAASQTEGGLWARFKKGVSAVAAFGDLDGDTETETHVHKVLVDYYVRTYGYIPTFLGGSGPSKRLSQPSGSVPAVRVEQAPVPPVHRRRPEYADERPMPRSTPKSSLKDVYKQSSQQQYQPGLHAQPAYAPSNHSAGSGHVRNSFDTVDSGRSGESRVREKLRRRPASPASLAGSTVSSASGGHYMTGSMTTITSTDGAVRYQQTQGQYYERQYR